MFVGGYQDWRLKVECFLGLGRYWEVWRFITWIAEKVHSGGSRESLGEGVGGGVAS